MLTVLLIMSFTMMALAETDIVRVGGEESVLVAQASQEKDTPKWEYGYEKVTKSYAGFLKYVYYGIAILAAVTMIFVEKKKFYRKPDPTPDQKNPDEKKQLSIFDRIFKI